jgi:hypothetical protein
VGFTLGAVGLHILYLIYSSLTFVLVVALEGLARTGREKAKSVRED